MNRLNSIAQAQAAQGSRAQPLSEIRYRETHQAFEHASTQQALLRNALELAIVTKAAQLGRPIRVLSVGCGSGLLDTPILKDCREVLACYHGVEPNEAQFAAFSQRLEELGVAPVDTQIFHQSFEEFAHDHRGTDAADAAYDLIHCVHVMYYAADKERFLEALCGLSAPGGEVLIAQGLFDAMNALAQIFWADQNVPRFFAGELDHLLGGTALPWETATLEGTLAGAVLEPRTRLGQDVLSFLIQAEWQSLTPAVQTKIQAYLEQEMTQTPPGARLLRHPVALFTVQPKPLEATGPTGSQSEGKAA